MDAHVGLGKKYLPGRHVCEAYRSTNQWPVSKKANQVFVTQFYCSIDIYWFKMSVRWLAPCIKHICFRTSVGWLAQIYARLSCHHYKVSRIKLECEQSYRNKVFTCTLKVRISTFCSSFPYTIRMHTARLYLGDDLEALFPVLAFECFFILPFLTSSSARPIILGF
jgi:hypothetical protein